MQYILHYYYNFFKHDIKTVESYFNLKLLYLWFQFLTELSKLIQRYFEIFRVSHFISLHFYDLANEELKLKLLKQSNNAFLWSQTNKIVWYVGQKLQLSTQSNENLQQ